MGDDADGDRHGGEPENPTYNMKVVRGVEGMHRKVRHEERLVEPGEGRAFQVRCKGTEAEGSSTSASKEGRHVQPNPS